MHLRSHPDLSISHMFSGLFLFSTLSSAYFFEIYNFIENYYFHLRFQICWCKIIHTIMYHFLHTMSSMFLCTFSLFDLINIIEH